MKKHYTYILILTALLLVGLSACEMKASTPPPTSSTSLTTDIEMATMQAEAAIVQTNVAKGNGEGEAGIEGDPLVGTTITPAVTPDPNEIVPTPANTPTPIPVSISTFGVPSSYTIHKGDHPFCLGRRYDINPDDLLAYNGLYRGVILYPGNILQIPSNARSFPGTRQLVSHPTTYLVQSNDTFYSIACYFGDVDPRAIAAHNNMDVSQSLYVGSTIHIP